MEKQTVGDLLEKFDHFRRVPKTGNVIIHPGLTYNFIELKADFVDKLKNHLETSFRLSQAGIEELSPADQFAIMMLVDSY